MSDTFTFTDNGRTVTFSGSGILTHDYVSSVMSGSILDVINDPTSVSKVFILGYSSIGDGAFSAFTWFGNTYNTHITSITLPSSNRFTSIGGGAFSGCSGLISIVIPSTVTSIGEGAFADCSELTSIVIQSSITSIGTYMFSNCRSLGSIVIPSSVTSIGDSAFSGCSGLTSIIIPSGVTSISDRLFMGCSGLTSIVIPSRVAYIGESAFAGCSKLTSIVIPLNVTTIYNAINYEAFFGCSLLKTVFIPQTNKLNIVSSNSNYYFYGVYVNLVIVGPVGMTTISPNTGWEYNETTNTLSFTQVGTYSFTTTNNVCISYSIVAGGGGGGQTLLGKSYLEKNKLCTITVGGGTVGSNDSIFNSITAIGGSQGNGSSGIVTLSNLVLYQQPVINNWVIPPQNFGIGTFQINPPTSNSTGTFTYTSSNTLAATISGTTVTIVGVGETIITAMQAGTA